jgi:hypothetical protein
MNCVVFARFLYRLRATAGQTRWLPFLMIAALGCSHSPTAPPTPTGTLIVTVAIPFNATANYVVGGPSGYAQEFFGTDTIPSLLLGMYTIVAPTAASIDPIVTGLYTGMSVGSPATVSENDTSFASISFVTTPGTGGLWVGSGNSGNPVAAQYSSQELQSVSPPGITLRTGGAYVVFDSAGNLWTASSTSNTISEYLAAQLVSGGSSIPAVTIGGSGLNGPSGVAFDHGGNLWVSNGRGNSIVEYTGIQLASSGNPAPAVTLTSAAIDNPGAFSFDAYGNLWVPNFGSSTIVSFTPRQIVFGGNQSPSVTISANAGSLESPRALAFDEDGYLWVLNQGSNAIVEYGPGQLISGGSLMPIETLIVPAAHSGLSAMAFDNSGDMWITCTTSSELILYVGDQLVSGISAPPEQVQSAAAAPVSLAFNPRPDGLPLGGLHNSRLKRHRPIPRI